MRNTPSTGITRCRLDLLEESGAATRWKKVLTGGPHLSATQERGTRLAVKEERGRWRSAAGPDAGAGPRCEERKEEGKEVGRPRGLSWAAAFCAWLGRGKDRGWGVGLRAKTKGKGPFLFLFSFKTNLFQNIFKTKFEFLFNL